MPSPRWRQSVACSYASPTNEWRDASQESKERVITDFSALIDERLARLEVQRRLLLFPDTRPDWTYGNGKRVPQGTYQRDDEVQITEYAVEGALRSNFIIRRGDVTAYVEAPDMAGIFDGMKAVNERHASEG